MLKSIRGLFIVAVILIANAYVSPTYAASATVLMTHIQAGGVGAATQEIIILYNTSPDEIDITNWCLKNKSSIILCFYPDLPTQRVFLAGYSFATVGSQSFPEPILSRFFVPLSQSSGSITGSADTISLVDGSGSTIDSHAWTTSLAGGSLFERRLAPDGLTYQDTDMADDWKVSTLHGVPPDGVSYREVLGDVCLNMEGEQESPPDGFEVKPDGRCVKMLSFLFINEVLPNAKGSDTGHEFIEFYNPNDWEVDLGDYILRTGPTLISWYNLEGFAPIPPHSYFAIDNTRIPYSLLNTASLVQLTNFDGDVLSEMEGYTDPAEDMAWAYINGLWEYTSRPTPGAENQSSSGDVVIEEPVERSLEPCAPNQYRSLETNRCRLIASPATTAPCKDGQYRSEETNRCRNIATDANLPKPCDAGQERNEETGRCRNIVVASLPAPCKAGQERNPETNRCRNIVSMTKADYAVLGTSTQSGGSSYLWIAISGLILIVLGYAGWEWRWELGKLFQKMKRFVRIRK